MPIELLAGVAFTGLFLLLAILPTQLQKRHAARQEASGLRSETLSTVADD